MDDLDNLSEEQLQQLMQLGAVPDQQTYLDEQIKQAQRIRNSQAPQGYDTGRVYVAASPLEHLAHAMEGIKANKDLKNLRQQQQDLLAQQVAGRTSYMDALLGRLRMGKGKHSFVVRQPRLEDPGVDPSLVQSPEVG